MAYFFLRPTTTATTTTTNTVTFTLSGTDAASYDLSPSSSALLVDAEYTVTTDSPTVTIETSTAITQQFTVTSVGPATIYWGIAFTSTFARPCEYIQEQALNFTQFFIIDPAQEQFGFVIAPANTATFTVGNLLSDKDYTLSVCTELVNGVDSGPILTNFTSVDNNIRIVKVEFTFDSALSTAQELTFACFLASEFMVTKTG